MNNKLVGHIYAPKEIHGKSAYEIAVMHGFDGTEEEWIEYQMTEAERRAQEVADKSIAEMQEVSEKALEDVNAAKTAAMTEIDNRDRSLLANAIKNRVTGNVVVLDDVSPLEHTISVKARGKNLIPFPYLTTDTDFDGLTYNIGENGRFVANGTATKGTNFFFARYLELPAGTYTFSYEGTFTTNGAGAGLFIYNPYTQKVLTSLPPGLKSRTFTTTEKETIQVYLSVSYADVTVNCDLYPQLEVGPTATEYKPWIDPTTVTMKRYGSSEADNPQTYTPNADGTVEGVTSIYPTTTLMTDTEGVELDVEYNRDANKVVAELFALIQGSSKISHIDLLASKWQGSASPYSQVVAIDGATEYSKIDINPSVEQLAIFHTKDIAFVAENEDGVVTVYCIGQKPTADYTMQITITEVLANG